MSPSSDTRRWLGLVLLCATQFMVVLDVAIVNVALPSIKTALDFSEENLQWVVSAYTLTFGGFLLLGGRAADLLGRRRVFMIGLAGFAAASLVCGLSSSSGVLIAARAVQGLGAAVISPAALSILTTTFAEGAERNRALGIWGAIAGLGGAAGVLLGGILTDTVGWEWIFFINVPVGAAVIAFAPRLLDESRVEGVHRGFDVSGAVAVTGGLSLLVYGLVETATHSWTSTRVGASLVAAAALIAAFVVLESRRRSPLLPLRLFRLRSLSAANLVGFLLGASIFAMFFLLSLYMQQVLAYSPLRTGVGYLLVASTIIVSAAASQALVTRVGVRTVLTIGQLMLVLGLLWFTQVSVGGSYLVDLAPGFLLVGVGLGFSFVPVTIAALVGVEPHDAGIASGLINTSQQIGGALGVALLSTIAFTRANDYVSSHAASVAPQLLQVNALTDGFSIAFASAAGMALLGLIATRLFIPRHAPAPGTLAAAELEPSRA